MARSTSLSHCLASGPTCLFGPAAPPMLRAHRIPAKAAANTAAFLSARIGDISGRGSYLLATTPVAILRAEPNPQKGRADTQIIRRLAFHRFKAFGKILPIM